MLSQLTEKLRLVSKILDIKLKSLFSYHHAENLSNGKILHKGNFINTNQYIHVVKSFQLIIILIHDLFYRDLLHKGIPNLRHLCINNNGIE